MNLFIDTSVLFTDPFWNENFPSQLLEVAGDNRIKLFVSEVVLKELRHNFEKNIDKEFQDIKRSSTTLRKMLMKFDRIELPEKEECLEQFDRFYTRLQNNGILQVLPLDNNLLPVVLERAVKRIKPFTEKKTELKDALIWLSYTNYVNGNNLDNCFFITENTTDFCDTEKLKEKIFELHPDLVKDCPRFQLFLNFKGFYKANSEWLDKPIKEFKEWFDQQNINENYVFDLLVENRTSKINDEIEHHIENLDPDHIFQESYLITMGGYIQAGDIEWFNCSNIETEVTGNHVIVSGTLSVNAEIQGYGYNSERDPGDEKFPFVGEQDVDIDMDFAFSLDIEGKLSNFEVLNVSTK